MKRALFISGLFSIALILFVTNTGFTCGGVGPCIGIHKGEHKHARLTIYDATRHKVPIPDNIGRTEVTTLEGKESFCYDALHTHHADGKLHIQMSNDNDTTLGTFLTKWNPGLLQAKILVNGRRIKNPKHFNIKPEMNIKIFMRRPR